MKIGAIFFVDKLILVHYYEYIPYGGIVYMLIMEDNIMDKNNECLDSCKTREWCERTTVREDDLKSGLVKRLNRVEGQIRGIKGMIEKDVYCDDVLNQVSAAQAALNSINKLILENHIRGCLVKKIRNGDDEIVDELLVTIGKML